ncbi:MAG: DUF4423 domain-containing protein [Deltaproteobacteria bacterium]|nr:DUF4423 domain-containing protein [Deltaproteobacteria bacterium]MBI3294553.1 DUF4423 domain-containing protein [Deltaproteobacteria bacterium]
MLMNSIPNHSVKPREVLRRSLLLRQERNSHYSLRAFARDLNVSHSYLSLVLNDQIPLSIKHAINFSERLGFDEELKQRFVKSALERPTAPTAVPERNDDLFFLEIDKFKLLSDWRHFAILDLTEIKGFQANTQWIARRLGCSRRQVTESVKRLERLGLLERDGKRWKKTHKHMAIPTSRAHPAMQALHADLIHKALATLRSTKQSDYEKRDISGALFVINSKRLPEAKQRIERFRRSLMKFLGTGECDELYQLNVQLFNLTKEKGKVRK